MTLMQTIIFLLVNVLTGIYWFKVINGNTRAMYVIRSELTKKTHQKDANEQVNAGWVSLEIQ